MNVTLISVPYDSGFRSVRMGAGPDRLLAGGLVDQIEARGHRVHLIPVDLPPNAFLPEVGSAFRLAGEISRAGSHACAQGGLPVVLAGNCMASVGVVSALDPATTGVVWFDSHGDLNTPATSGSGFLDGMAVAVLTGRCWPRLADEVPGYRAVPEDRIVFAGVRDLDPAEARHVEDAGMRLVGPGALVRELPTHVGQLAKAVDGLYVHVDLDVIDPDEIRANQYAAPGGPSVDAVEAALGRIAATSPVRGVSFTAYDPSFDPTGGMVAVVVRFLDALASGAA